MKRVTATIQVMKKLRYQKRRRKVSHFLLCFAMVWVFLLIAVDDSSETDDSSSDSESEETNTFKKTPKTPVTNGTDGKNCKLLFFGGGGGSGINVFCELSTIAALKTLWLKCDKAILQLFSSSWRTRYTIIIVRWKSVLRLWWRYFDEVLHQGWL